MKINIILRSCTLSLCFWLLIELFLVPKFSSCSYTMHNNDVSFVYQEGQATVFKNKEIKVASKIDHRSIKFISCMVTILSVINIAILNKK